MSSFLKTHKTSIIDSATREPLYLKGVNLGGWLLMEAYIMGAPNYAESVFKKEFAKELGQKQLIDFEIQFRKNYIQEEDVRRIAGLGMNCIRVPFHHRLIEDKPYKYLKSGIQYLDEVIQWARKYNIWVILDLHAAAGAQNRDWHGDSTGKAELWTKKACRQRTYALWEFLADRYKHKPQVAGYDLLNEAVIEDAGKLNSFYKELIKVIRKVDKNHILFVEGNTWATNLACLEPINDDNYVLSVHQYVPLFFTFNLVPHLVYPVGKGPYAIDKAMIQRHVAQYGKEAEKRQVPVYCGEFGINDREGKYGEDLWLKDVLDEFKRYGFHWTYWTYKTIKNATFPDGLYCYYDNPPWVNREGPLTGWDTYSRHWLRHRVDMIKSWRTEFYRPSTAIVELLKKYV